LNQNQFGPMENLETAIREMVQFAYQNPRMFELMRSRPRPGLIDSAQWDNKRNELRALIESIIRSGIADGKFNDPHPDFTARFIPSMVRSVLMEGFKNIDARTLAEHILRFVRAGLLNSDLQPCVRQASTATPADAASRKIPGP